MPLYEFKCDDPESPYHKNPYSVLWSMKEYEEKKDTLKCPNTGKPLHRIYAGKVGFKFIGSGFYVNDKVLSNP